jgi:shikimate dehydrogenase
MTYIEHLKFNLESALDRSRVYGIIGDPIEHSVSPAMHNAAFRELGLDYTYVLFLVKSEKLNPAIQGVRALNISGLNVTIPHKVAVIPFLDELDAMAENLGAVNTIVNQNGYLKGYNTDASGFLRALLAEKIDPTRKKIVILGAGGAARAISFILADKGAELTIINRHPGPAERVADRLFRTFRREVRALELNRVNLKAALEDAEIVVNTTSVGMYPSVDETPVPSRFINKRLVVFDIIYNPLRTRLLAEAEKRGAKIISGIEMLVWQGAAALELWTGRQAPVEAMRQAAIQALEAIRQP